MPLFRVKFFEFFPIFTLSTSLSFFIPFYPPFSNYEGELSVKSLCPPPEYAPDWREGKEGNSRNIKPLTGGIFKSTANQRSLSYSLHCPSQVIDRKKKREVAKRQCRRLKIYFTSETWSRLEPRVPARINISFINFISV